MKRRAATARAMVEPHMTPTALGTNGHDDRVARVEHAKTVALQTLAAIGVADPSHIDLEKIAAAFGAEIRFDDLEGAAARVIRIGNRARIVVSTRIADASSIRFSIAHEIGHLACKHYVRSDSTEPFSSRLFMTDTRIEHEASVFATELLMPAPLVTPWCRVMPVSLDPARAIAAAFQTSLLASAMRFVELSPEPCALVYSELGRVRWVSRSTSFSGRIPTGRAVAPASAAFDYFDHGVIDELSRIVPAATWIPAAANDEVPLHEHTSTVAIAGAVFSLLWLPRAG